MYRFRASIASALLVASITVTFTANAQGTYGDDSIPAGCHPITAAERAALQAMGATIPSNGMYCDKDKALLNGGCAENPYPYLQSKNKTGRPDSVSGLNSDFACRMYKFMKAADAAGMNLAIGSGYRSMDMQKGMYQKYLACGKCGAPVAPPGVSKHNFGLAVDLHYNGQLGNFVSKSPQNTPMCIQRIPACSWAHANYSSFGLRYPMTYEPWHIEPSGAVNGRQQPLPEGGWQSDDSGARYTNTGAPYNPATWNPSMAPQPQMFSPLGSSGSPTGSSAPTQTGTVTNPTYTNTPANYDAIPLPTATSSIFTAPPPYTFPTSTSTNIGGGSDTQSYYEKLLLMASSSSTGTSAPTGGSLTGSSTQLNDDLYDIDTGSTQTGGTNTQEGTLAVIATNSVAINPIHVTQTFSGTNNPPQTASTGLSSAQNKSLIVALLTTLRDLLVSYLNFLKSQPKYGFQGSWQMKR